jgi:hypothetical protein
VREQRGELGRQRLLGIHGHRHTISMTGRGSKVNVILLQILSLQATCQHPGDGDRSERRHAGLGEG